MSHELFERIKKMNLDNLNLQLALQCSPLLTGIKISNILIVNRRDEKRVRELFDNTAISYYVLYQTSSRITFLLYQKERVVEYLGRQDVQCVMNMLGYDQNEMDLNFILECISMAYSDYMMLKMNKELFPHELGLLLGYPPEDVVGFIMNAGQNSLYTGYWKVYGNPNQAARTFAQYDNAKEQIIRMVCEGVSISYVLGTYYANQQTG